MERNVTDDIDPERRNFVNATAIGLAAARLGMLGSVARPMVIGAGVAPAAGELASLSRATTWINTAPLSEDGLRGKVVLIDVWTYTCINWLRTLPYVRAWSEKYRGDGLVVISVHAPEFAFEHDLDNVRRMARELKVAYPVAVDNSFAIWRAFRNRYWPALYLIDARGMIRHRQFGEGEYERSEQMIQRLLTDAGAGIRNRGLVSVNGRGAEAAPDWRNLKSPENYLGYERTTGFASPGDAALNRPHAYTLPSRLRLHQWAVAGEWTIRNQAITLNRAEGRIAARFHARDLHLVMGPAMRGAAVRFRVLIDGAPPGPAGGTDVDARGNGVITDQRLYQLIRQPGPIEDRTFEIVFLDPGADAFAFTFG